MVVDTMVFAYALLGVEEFRQDATATLEQADTISVPDIFQGGDGKRTLAMDKTSQGLS